MVSMGSVYSWSLPIWVLRIDWVAKCLCSELTTDFTLVYCLTVTEIWLEPWMSLALVEHLRFGLTV